MRSRVASEPNTIVGRPGCLRARYESALQTGVSSSSSSTGSPSSRSPRAKASGPMWLPFVNSTSGRPEARIASSTSAAPGSGTAPEARVAVDERAVDVEDEAADVVKPHGATPPGRRPSPRARTRAPRASPARGAAARADRGRGARAAPAAPPPRSATIASTCSSGIVSRSSSSSSEMRSPKRAPGALEADRLEVAQLLRARQRQQRVAHVGVDGRGRLVEVAEEVAQHLVADVRPALAARSRSSRPGWRRTGRRA